MNNAVLENIQNRRSVRLYDDADISESDIQTVLQAANHAPSAHNQQSWRFIVVRGARKQNLASLVSKKAAEFPKTSSALLRMAARSISSAPVVVGVVNTGEMVTHATDLFSLNKEESRDFFRTMEIQSSAAAIQNMLLAASSLGISSVWLGVLILIKDDVLRFFEETGGELMAVVPFGYSGKTKAIPSKKSLEAKVKYL
ncbi:MAG: nitroreductase family protein [Desulfuromonadaceae bacterium]